MSSSIPYMSLPSANYPNDAFENAPMAHTAVVEIVEAKRMIPLDVAKGPLTAGDVNAASEDFEGIDMARLRRYAESLKWLTGIAALIALIVFSTALVAMMGRFLYMTIFFLINIPILIGLAAWSVVSAVFAFNLLKQPKRIFDIFWGAVPTLCVSALAAVFGLFSNFNLPIFILSLVLGAMQIPIIVISRLATSQSDDGCCC